MWCDAMWRDVMWRDVIWHEIFPWALDTFCFWCFALNVPALLPLLFCLKSPLNIAKHVGAKPPPKCFVSSWVFHIISHYFTLLKKYWLFLHQTWQMSRRPIANYIYVKNVSKCQSCYVTVMTSCFLPLLKFLICIFFYIVFERAHQGVLKPKKILSISQKLNEIWQF